MGRPKARASFLRCKYRHFFSINNNNALKYRHFFQKRAFQGYYRREN